MSLPDTIILSLACWRVAFFVTHDNAPFDLMKRLREHDKSGGLSCIRCLSIWAAAMVAGLWFTPLQPLVYIAAISGGALMLHKYTGWDFVQSNSTD